MRQRSEEKLVYLVGRHLQQEHDQRAEWAHSSLTAYEKVWDPERASERAQVHAVGGLVKVLHSWLVFEKPRHRSTAKSTLMTKSLAGHLPFQTIGQASPLLRVPAAFWINHRNFLSHTEVHAIYHSGSLTVENSFPDSLLILRNMHKIPPLKTLL